MKIRAVTLGADLPWPAVEPDPFRQAAEFLRDASAAFEGLGLEVQTTRMTGPDLSAQLAAQDSDGFAAWATDAEAAAMEAGIGYLSLGRVPAARWQVVESTVARVIAGGSIASLSADLVEEGQVALRMAAACAKAVKALATTTPGGFGNFRFAATAGCPPNIPFLPAAFHVGGRSRFSIAFEAADVVLDALAPDGSVASIEDRLVAALEAAAGPVQQVGEDLAAKHGIPFVGIDLSPAPEPLEAVSIGGAIEAAGVDRFGAPGTLYVAALVTRAVRRTRLRRSGFSGLMLPIMEDSVLARRMAERPLSVHELLLYSAVCGTGLDTVPLPGDVSEEELAGIYLDVAALSIALGGKPLTARLFPVPGSRPGALTTYTFDYFANTRVPPAAGAGAGGLLERAR